MFLRDYARKIRLGKIVEYLDFEDNILDIGCGKDMYLSNELSNRLYHVVGLDLEGGNFVGDAKNLPFKDGVFDKVIAVELLEHVDCIEEIKRVLKLGGLLIATTPTLNADNTLKFLEKMKWIASRVTPHTNLMDLKDLPMILIKHETMFMGLTQFGVFKKD